MALGGRGLLTRMDINEWVKRTDLSSPITEVAVLLVGRDGTLPTRPTRAIGSGVFVADRLNHDGETCPPRVLGYLR